MDFVSRPQHLEHKVLAQWNQAHLQQQHLLQTVTDTKSCGGNESIVPIMTSEQPIDTEVAVLVSSQPAQSFTVQNQASYIRPK